MKKNETGIAQKPLQLNRQKMTKGIALGFMEVIVHENHAVYQPQQPEANPQFVNHKELTIICQI